MKAVLRNVLVATTSMIAVGGMVSAAQASGIINSSQSAVFNGMSYAGFAAPGSSSPATMFMNPATMTGFKNFTIDSNYTFGVPVTKINGATNSPAINGLYSGSSGDVGKDYFVPATYIIYPVNDRLFLGLSVNTTYGNTTKPDALWRGSFFAATSKLRITTATPSVAYKINEMWSVGVGLQVQYGSARQYQAIPPAGIANAGISSADGWGVGVSAGVTFTPVKTTQIGLGWRSFVDHKLSGTTVFPAAPFRDPSAKGTLNLPNRINLSLRQTLTDKFDLLASVEWQNLSRLGNGRLNTVFPALAVLPFGYSDGWMFALGGEYKYNNKLTLRAGAAYEKSGVTDAIRRVSLPDNDRIWLSSGFTYDVMDRLSVNASYSFLHIKKAPITQTAGALTFTGTSKATAHLISLGLTSRWGDAPAKEQPLVKKF